MTRQSEYVSHKWHSHPQTRNWSRKCRDSVLAGEGPLVDPAYVRDGVPGLAPNSVDAGDGSGISHIETEPWVPPNSNIGAIPVPPISRKPFFMPMEQIVELDEMLGRLNEVLDGYAVTKSAVIRFDKDGLELAVIWNGEQWGVQVGD